MQENWGWDFGVGGLTYKCGGFDLQQMSLSRFLTSTHFREQVIRSYNLQRDLKSCLSLKQAEKIVEQRSDEIKQYGKTAFLQFLNGFPLNYSYKMLNGPLKIFLFTLQLKDLSIYEQQLKYSIFNKLREFVCNNDKPTVQAQIQRSQQTLTEMIKIKPFDATHAMNFLHCQKDSKNSQLFYHCLDVIRKTEYRILELVMPKFLPVFVKRLNSDEWNIIRKFEYFTDNIIFDFIPKQPNAHKLIYLLDNLCQLQLHIVGYLKIPPAIDYIMGYFIANLNNQAIVDSLKLNILFSCFDYLPMGYNQPAFNAIYNKILQKKDKDPLYFNYVPYRRLSPQQSSTLMDKFIRHQFSFNSILYIGNKAQLRQEFLKTQLPKDLHREFFMQHQAIRRTFFNSLIAAVVLLDYYKNDRNMMSTIRERWKVVAGTFVGQCDPQNYVKFFSLANALNLMRLNSQLKGIHNHLQSKLIQDQLYRSRNEDFKQRKYHQNVLQAVDLFADSPIPQIRRLLIDIILNIRRKQDKFYFQRFSFIIFKLLKSNHCMDYHDVVRSLLMLVGEGECQYFVEIFNRNQGKNHRALFEVLKILKKVDPSFQCMGKFMVTSNYSQFTSNRGELVLQYRKILQAIEPMLNIHQLKGYVLPEMAAILRFCNHFYFYISEFSRKFLMIALEHAEGLIITRDGGKFLIQFIQEAVKLKWVSHATNNVNRKCIALIKKANEAFPDNVLLKAKEIEFLNLLGESKSEDHTALIVDEILSQLSSSNYSPKHADTMVLLLKLNCLQVIKLKEVVVDKLQSLVELGLEANQIKVKDVVNQLYFVFRRNNSQNSERLGKGISKLLSLCLDKTKSKHNFEYYIQFVDFGHFLRNTDLVQKGFNCLTQPILYVHHIKRIVNLLRFYRNISCDLLVQKILQEAARNFDHFHQQAAELLYTCHHIKNKTILSQFGDTCIILDKLTALLANPQSSLKNKEAMALKHLWVSFKINKFDPSLKPVFKIAVDSFKDVKSGCEKGNYQGINSQNIAYLYMSMLRYVEANNPSWLDDYKSEAKSLFKSKNKTVSSTDTIIQECSNMLKNLNKLFTEENRAVLTAELNKAGFKRKGNDHSEDNVFELDKTVNQVILNAWVQKDGKQYGVLLKRDHFYSRSRQQKGRIDFTINTLSKITGAKVLLLQPGKELNFE